MLSSSRRSGYAGATTSVGRAGPRIRVRARDLDLVPPSPHIPGEKEPNVIVAGFQALEPRRRRRLHSCSR